MANANGKITWTNERRKLSELIPWPRNPRQIKTDQAKRLVESFDQFGQVETIAIGPDGDIYNGHQRLNVLAEKYGKDYEIEVRVSDRALSEKEREKLTIFLHKGAAGEWDFDTLANEFELDDLLEWGFRQYELGIPDGIQDPNEEWKGMPEFEQEDRTAFRSIVVHFENKNDVDEFSILLDQTITDRTKYLWFPYKPKAELLNLIYRDES